MLESEKDSWKDGRRCVKVEKVLEDRDVGARLETQLVAQDW
jgi:hypothetical protein